MALLPKQIEEIRAKRAQLKLNRESRLELESTDTEVIQNAITEDSKPQGQSRLPSLILSPLATFSYASACASLLFIVESLASLKIAFSNSLAVLLIKEFNNSV